MWIHPTDPSKSLIAGTDKDTDGGLFVYGLTGKIVNKVLDLKRPNNAYIANGVIFQNRKVDLEATTETELNKIRIYELPTMKEIVAVDVFAGETEKALTLIALYTNPQHGEIHAIVGRKSGPSENYPWHYKLTENNSRFTGEVVNVNPGTNFPQVFS